ncbi:sensor histidine kinase [Paenibacillus eucommiae]|uniref:histidine kinase n=1 Tax=Paenibacillus eucommiae TaxID=1355755 RepID=A0ABS4IXS2_9BACL|nr:HAMP domain-containing sensor histidine kinase [Paenibacillus eucommiae]MBP1992382.1 signal transduction histidine kinase [Paenibacillus eucommiae]
MSIKLKITLLLSAWLLIILLLGNSVIYFLFIRITTNSEAGLLREKANTLIAKDLYNHPEYWQKPGPLDEFLIPQEMIRLVTPDLKVLHEVYTDEELLKQRPHYTNKETTKIVHVKGGYYIYVMMPVYNDRLQQLATLEIGQSLGALSGYLETLVSVLLFTSIGTVMLSYAGLHFYIKVILKPLDQLIATMQTIEENGVFKRIHLPDDPKQDELTLLGATFNRMIDRLEDTFLKHRQFLADASHELRTPITVIDSYASLLRRWASSDPALREEALDAIQTESAQLKKLTENLLSLMEEEHRMKRVDFDLTPLIVSTAASLKLTFNRNIETRLPEGDDNCLTMQGDPEKIKQLLIILIDNAVKYSKQTIIVSAEKNAHYIKLQVEDRGIGISKEDLPRLFDRFYRTDKARNRKQGGAGLGLAIADNIVRLHQGTITISSQLGKGTLLTVKLPTTCQ